MGLSETFFDPVLWSPVEATLVALGLMIAVTVTYPECTWKSQVRRNKCPVETEHSTTTHSQHLQRLAASLHIHPVMYTSNAVLRQCTIFISVYMRNS